MTESAAATETTTTATFQVVDENGNPWGQPKATREAAETYIKAVTPITSAKLRVA
jgi:hypothetical protein